MYGSLYWEEKVNCFSVCPFERPPEAVQDIKSRHVRSHYASSSLIKLTSPATLSGAQDGSCNSNICWLQEDIVVISATPFSGSRTYLFFFCNCQLFFQAKYWNSSVNEVEGTITDTKGKVIHRLFGKWHEAVFCGDPPSATCIWRASMTSFFHENKLKVHISLLQCLIQWMLFVCNVDAMPVDHEQYYGFTKFAIELNELDPSLKLLLPPTDTRLRVDQRYEKNGGKIGVFTYTLIWQMMAFNNLISETSCKWEL